MRRSMKRLPSIIAVPLLVSLLAAAPASPFAAPPKPAARDAARTEIDLVVFDPQELLALAVGDRLPSDFLVLDAKGLLLSSRRADAGGTHLEFLDPTEPRAHASIFVRAGRVAGTIEAPGDRRIVLASDAPGMSRVRHEDARKDLPCGLGTHDLRPPVGQAADGGVAGAACTADSGRMVDLLVVYTDAAVTQAGSEQTLLDSIAWVVADSNGIYSGTGIQLQARLVGTARLEGYAQNASMADDLYQLTDVDDGIIDGVHATRDALGADLVAMIRGDGGGACGVAWLANSTSAADMAPYGFSVTALGCIGGRTFTHELGHNMGCCHAPGDGGGCLSGGVTPYAVGNRFTGTDALQYRTVMAYSPGTRIPRFSSPTTIWAGTATGIANERDNGRSIGEMRPTFANFRCSVDGLGTCGTGASCVEAHGARGCADGSCCLLVCAADPTCCSDGWDSSCVERALQTCVGTCAADSNADFLVNGADLAALLGAWGSANAVSDLNDDGMVNGSDLAILLGAWGPCR